MQPANHKPPNQKPLGAVVAVYRGQPVTWRDILLLMITGSLMVLAPFLYGLWRARYASIHFGPAAAEIWGLPWYGLSAVAIIPWLFMCLLRIRRSQRAVIVFKNGLGIQKSPRMKFALRWIEISGITFETIENRFLGNVIRKQARLTIHPSIGKPIKIHRLIPNQGELSARIKAKINPRLLPVLRNSFKAGENLYFGQIVLNHHVIQLWGKNIPWEQVTLINARQGFLVVELKNQMVRKIPIGQIPNIELLIQIIQEGVEA